MKPKSLTLSKYQPNFADPRVRSRVELVLDFCKPMLIQRKAKPISSSVLTRIFGNQKSDLAARLRHKLLQQEGTYTPMKQTYSYTLKRDGYAELSTAIGQLMPADAQVARSLYYDIASGAIAPVYTEPTLGARRYHAVQTLPKALRAAIFIGWYDYDIEAAAPTLVYQLACKVYRALYPMKLDTPYLSIAKLVEDRASVRQHVAKLVGVEAGTAKKIVVALFFAAKLVPHQKQAIFQLLRQDRSMLELLKADRFVQRFQREVRTMWQGVLMDDYARHGRVAFNGGPLIPKAATKAKQRMEIYLRLERQVIDVVEAELQAIGIVPVLIHDGFMVRSKIDRVGLEQAIESSTGYVIRLAEAEVGLQDENLKDSVSDEILEMIDK